MRLIHKAPRAGVLVAAIASCFSPDTQANPIGPAVANGQVSILRNANLLQITNSPSSIINWQSFSIGAGEITRFIQQSSASAVLNRVTTQNPSSILGSLQSNGRVLLLNPSGIVFGPGSQVNVGSLVASSLNLSDSDFLGGRLNFTQVPGAGAVVNQGTINTTQGGSVYLIGPAVTNSGIITSPKGEVVLAAGNSVQLVDPGTPNLRVAIDAPDNQALNLGQIVADSGRIGIYAGLINQAGTIRADRAETDASGNIVLKATTAAILASSSTTSASSGGVSIDADHVLQGGTITVSDANGAGGSISVNAASGIIETQSAQILADGATLGGAITVNAGSAPQSMLFSSATYSATGERGGAVTLLGNDIRLVGASVDASGTRNGGTILVGGGFQGKDPLIPNASTTNASFSSSLKADATQAGDGGRIVVWSDTSTVFRGSVSARGGPAGGNGGSLEVSSKDKLFFGGTGDASAPLGQPGNLLLDPKDIIIDASATSTACITQICALELVEPPGHANTGGGFGAVDGLTVLPNGNIVVAKPNDSFVAANAGAVYLFNGSTGALISTLSGSSANDNVGGPIQGVHNANIALLSNGNFVVASPNWNNGAASAAGAVTFVNGSTGLTGAVSSANSLVGSSTNDQVGIGIGIPNTPMVTPLKTDGNYVVVSPYWNNGAATQAGAVTFGNGTTGVTGVVSSANSLVGTFAGDMAGSSGATPLTNGNYVVASSHWSNNGTTLNAGAATWGSRYGGVSGTISSANSLVGANERDLVGAGGVTALTDGNYVVVSPYWSNGVYASDCCGGRNYYQYGAVTWGNGAGGTTGSVTPANSLTGQNFIDRLGYGFDYDGFGDRKGVVPLDGGKYLVVSPNWTNPTGDPLYGGALGTVGAVTFAPAGGITGNVSAANSLIGSSQYDHVGSNGAVVLSNGNYVVLSPLWHNSGVASAGAATFGNTSLGGIVGTVSPGNSLVGTTANDQVGSAVTALTNGNYVVSSPSWTNSGAAAAGAATFGDGSIGVVGSVSSTNSLVGMQASDQVGSGVKALTNGNYVVQSPNWANGSVTQAGAATFGNGAIGITGAVSPGNSLVGTQAGDQVSFGDIVPLTNGNYVVTSVSWYNGPLNNAGAATLGNGLTGISGPVSDINSLVGTHAFDVIGQGRTLALANGGYAVASNIWNGGQGAVTFADANGVTGAVTSSNSIIGVSANSTPISYSVTFPYNGTGVFVSSPFQNTDTVSGAGRLRIASLGSAQPGLLAFTDNASTAITITPASITGVTNNGTAVTLQANNNITVNAGSPIVTSAGGNGGSITLQAGNSILLNSNITTDNGALTLVANETAANGVIAANRDAGVAVITQAPGTTLNAGSGSVSISIADGAGRTGAQAASGDITLANITTTGSLTVSNLGPTAGGRIVLGGTVQPGNAALTAGAVEIAGGTLRGSGTLTLNGGTGTLLNNGSIAPGSAAATGTLTVDGNVTFGSGSSLDLRLGGANPGDYDVLAVSGTASLGGTVNASLFNGFTPSGQSLPVLTAATRTGKFSTHNLPASFGPTYSATDLTLTHGLTGLRWDNDSNDFHWTNPRNWNFNRVPVNTDDVYLDVASGSQAQLLASSPSVQSITSSANNGLLINGGALTVLGAANLSGSTTVQSGSLTLQGNSTLGTASVAAGGTLSVNSTATVAGDLTSGGALRGSGTLTLNGGAGTLFNNGSIAPGSAAATGTLSVSGNVVFGAASSLDLRIGGANPGDYDVLAVSGTANLNGTLNASFVNGFTPALDSSFPVLTFAGGSGTFATYNFPTLVSQTYNATNLTLNYGLTGIFWDNDARDFLWSNPLNWSLNRLPTSTDKTTLNIAAGSHADVTTGAHTVGSLTSNSNNALLINGGSLTVVGTANLAGYVTVQSGSLTLNGTSNVANYAQSGTGTFNGSGNVTVTNSFSHTGGTFASTGDVSITQAAGNLALSQPLRARSVQIHVPSGSLSESGQGAVLTGSLSVTTAGGQTLGGANQVDSFSGSNSGSGDVMLANSGSSYGLLQITGISNSAPGGSVSVTNKGPINVTGGVNTGGTGSTSLTTTDFSGTGNIFGGNDIGINAPVGNATLGGTTSLTSASGIRGDGLVTGDRVVLEAAGFIFGMGYTGNSPNGINTAAGTLAASAGSVIINNAGPVTLDNIGPIQNSGPTYSLTSAGTITVAAAGVNTTGTNSTSLTTTGATSDIVLNGSVGTYFGGQTTSLSAAGNITGPGLVTGDTVILTAWGGIGTPAVPVNTSSTSSLQLNTKGIGASGDINLVEANPLPLARTSIWTDSSTVQSVTLSAPAITVDYAGGAGTFFSIDNLVLSATTGDIAGAGGGLNASDLTLIAAGGIGAGAPVFASVSGKTSLTTRGAGTAGDIMFHQYGTLSTDKLTVSTDASKHTINLSADSIDILADFGNSTNDLVLTAVGGDIGSAPGKVLTGANIALDAAGSIGGHIYWTSTVGSSGNFIPIPVTVDTPGNLSLTSRTAIGSWLTANGNIDVAVKGGLDTSRLQLATFSGGSQLVSISAPSIVLSKAVVVPSDYLTLVATAGDISGSGLVSAGTLNLTASGGIGVNGDVMTSTSGILHLETHGAGSLGNIRVTEANPIIKGPVELSTDASTQTVRLTAPSMSALNPMGDASDDLFLTATKGDIVGGELLTARNLTLSAKGGLGVGASLNTSRTGTLNLTTQGVGQAGNISLSDANALDTGKLSITTDKSSQTVSLAAKFFVLGGPVGSAADDLVLTSTTGDINGAGLITAKGLTLSSAGGIGIGGALNTGRSGILHLSSQGAATAGNISVSEANALDTSDVTLSTIYSAKGPQTIALAAPSITLGAPIGLGGANLNLTATAGDINGPGLVTANDLTLSAKGGIGITAPVNVNNIGTLSLASQGAKSTGNINVSDIYAIDGTFPISTDPSSSQTVQLGASSFTVRGSLWDSADDLAFVPAATKGVGGVPSGNGVVTVAANALVTFAPSLSFALQRPLVNQGTITVPSGYTLAVQSGGSFQNAATGSIGGGGAIDMRDSGKALQNDGQIAPGSGIATGLAILGDAIFGSNSSLSINRYADGSFDSLSVSGRANLAGTLLVTDPSSAASGYMAILSYGSRDGTFTTLKLPKGYSTLYQPDRLIIAPPLAPEAGSATASATNQAGNSLSQLANLLNIANSASSTDANGGTAAADSPGQPGCSAKARKFSC